MTATYFLGKQIVDAAYKGDEAVYGRNLLTNSNDFTTGWSNYQGATVTRTPNQTVEEWGATDATRIQTSGGTHEIKTHRTIGYTVEGVRYSKSIYIKNIGENVVRVNWNGVPSGNIFVQPGESLRVIGENGIGNGSSSNQIQILALNATDSLDFIAWRPQIVEGTKVPPWSPAPEDLIE